VVISQSQVLALNQAESASADFAAILTIKNMIKMKSVEKNQQYHVPSDYGNLQGRKAPFSITSAPPFYFESNNQNDIENYLTNEAKSENNLSVDSENEKSHSFLTIGRKAPFSITSVPPFYRFFSFVRNACRLVGKRTFLVTGILGYWFVIMKYLVGYFEIGLFMFIVGLSLVFSTLFKSWGLVEWGLKS